MAERSDRSALAEQAGAVQVNATVVNELAGIMISLCVCGKDVGVRLRLRSWPWLARWLQAIRWNAVPTVEYGAGVDFSG